MAWLAETGSGSARPTDRKDCLTKIVSFLTSQHVDSVVINAAGTGYTVGDVLTLTHAGAHFDARFEVESITGGGGTGPIDTMRIVQSGAFSDRLNGSVTIDTGGSGYDASSTVILEIDGGTTRCPAKIEATTDGSGVVTSAVLFEDLSTSAIGAYDSVPTYPAATSVIGPNGASEGTGCTITMGGSTGLIGTTGLSVTGGTGSSATVDITLADTGWAVDERNTNDRAQNGSDDDKEVVLKGDADGFTNKPFVALYTGTAASGLNTRNGIAFQGMIAHNPSLDMVDQLTTSPGPDETSFPAGGSYFILGQNTANEGESGDIDDLDLWIGADDIFFTVEAQIDESASDSDSGVYIQSYGGFLDRVGTETEAPFPSIVFASSRELNLDPLVADDDVTGLWEQRRPSQGCGFMYDHVGGVWRNIENNAASGSAGDEAEIVWPGGQLFFGSGDDEVADEGPWTLHANVMQLDRSSATVVLRDIPGTTPQPMLWPLVVMRKPSGTADDVNDRIYGFLRNIFWISSDNGSGARITNYSEDFRTVGNDRYRVFHNHRHIQPYQYIAIKENV